jgi:general secretion pathway protein L
MSTLIICLPSGDLGANAQYDYVLTSDGLIPTRHGSAPLDLLPSAGRGAEVVAVVPLAWLSWHALVLPKGIGMGSSRLRPILEGLLEDRLLDEPAKLHLALAPGVDADGRVWVAACDKKWLHDHLQALEGAQRPVGRIVAEFAPELGPLQLHVIGEVDRPQLVLTGTAVAGVMWLPLTDTALALLPAAHPGEALRVQAEPAVAAAAEQFLQTQVSLLTRPQRLLDAVRSPWDLAQFDLASSGRARRLKRLSGWSRELLQAPGWRPARWGIAALLLAHLMGLNLWAWKEQAALQARRVAVQSALTQTFPEVTVVVDATLQMERQVAALRQATGASSGRDLEAILSALGAALPTGRTPVAIEFAAGEARFKGLQLSSQEAAGLADQLKQQGYAAGLDGDTLRIKQELVP